VQGAYSKDAMLREESDSSESLNREQDSPSEARREGLYITVESPPQSPELGKIRSVFHHQSNSSLMQMNFMEQIPILGVKAKQACNG
jgi:hypothetical protein